MAQSGTADLHVVILPGSTPRMKHVSIVKGELLPADEAELWTSDYPVNVLRAFLQGRSRPSDDRIDALQRLFKSVSGVTGVVQTLRTILVTALEDLAWPGITNEIMKIVSVVLEVRRERVHLHDLTDDAAMNIYVVGQASSPVRFFAVSHRPLTAMEVDALLDWHRFVPESSTNGDQLAVRNDQVIGDIWLQPGVEEAENQEALICVTSTSPDDWDTYQLVDSVARVLVNHAYISMEDVRVHDLTAADA